MRLFGHSMQPSTRLNRNFEDTDLLLADNFSRAAETVIKTYCIRRRDTS